MRPVLILALALATALPAAAQQRDPEPHIVHSVQNRLNYLGFRHVDASTLTNAQLAALHTQLQGRALSFGGFNRINAQSRVKVILGWED